MNPEITMPPRQALGVAVLAANSAAIAQYAKDGYSDVGECGGSLLQLKDNSRIAKAAVELGLAHKSGSGVWVVLPTIPGLLSQHYAIDHAAMRAFRKSLEASGFGKDIVKYCDYVD